MNQKTSNAEKQIVEINRAIDDDSLHLDEDQYLTFKVGEDDFAVEIIHVKEIISYEPLTLVPHVPDFIGGVINLRGNIIPIINLSRRFGKAGGEVTKLTCFIIVEQNIDDDTMEFGMLVDAVSEVIPINKENIEDAPSFGAKIRSDYIAGIGKQNDQFIIILNLSKVVDLKEIAYHQEQIFAE